MKRIVSMIIIGVLVGSGLYAQSTKVLIKTSLGDITVMLYDDTPLHKDNFTDLVNNKFYDGLIFHRVMEDFMIQAGDPNSKNAPFDAILGNGNPGYTLPAEFRKKHIHKKGALAAARKPDDVNPGKESSGSQFYIVQGRKFKPAELTQMEQGSRPVFTQEERKTYIEIGGTPWLDFNYTIFGEVVKGLDVVDAIANTKCNHRNRPLKDVTIISARIVK